MCQMRGYAADWKALDMSLQELTGHLDADAEMAVADGVTLPCFIESIGFSCIDPALQQTVCVVFFRTEATVKASSIELLQHCHRQTILHTIVILPHPLFYEAVKVLEDQDVSRQDLGLDQDDTEPPPKKSKGRKQKKAVQADAVEEEAAIASECTLPRIEVECFPMAKMQYDWTDNISHPQVYVCSEDEAREFYLKWNLKPSQVSGVLLDDALCCWYHLRQGQLVKLTRRGLPHLPDWVVVGNTK